MPPQPTLAIKITATSTTEKKNRQVKLGKKGGWAAFEEPR